VFANAEVDVLAPRSCSLELAGAFEVQNGLVRRPKVRGTAQEPRDTLRQDIENFARRFPASQALRVSGKGR